ncbi:MAG TPA: prolyl oligopeptidase family serine peptidase [Gemmatimonadaceae bacterium]
MRRSPAVARFALLLLFLAPLANAAGQALKVLNLPDYGRWNRITSTSLSTDGKWMSYAYQPNDGDATLFVKQLDGDKIFTIPIGSAPAAAVGDAAGGGRGGGGGGVQFSDDSRFVGYYVNPPEQAGGRGGRGGGGRGGAPQAGATAAAPRAVRRFEVLDLSTGEKFAVPNGASFRFAKGSAWLAVRLNKAPADTSFKGADLVLRDLKAATTRNVGNVNLYEFDDSGHLLAYTVDAAGHLGNGVYLMNLSSGDTRALNSSALEYDQLAWSDEGGNLAVLRGEKARDMKQRDNQLFAWTGAGTPNAKELVLDPSKDASFPKGMVLSEFTAPRWSKDGSRIFLGVKEQEPEIAATDSSKANVDVWHWKDPEPQTVQIVRLQQERRATLPAAYLTTSHKLVRLGDDDMRTATPTPNGKWAIGRNDAAYRGQVEWGANKADMYRVNTETGERALIDKTLSRTMGTSPDSKWFLYLKDKKVRAFNLETAQVVELNAPPGKNFLNEDDDHPYEIPVWGVGGWAKDGNSVLLYDKFDVWQLSLTGAKPVNLTAGVGKAQQIQFRVVRLGAGGGRGGRGGGGGRGGAGAAEEEGIDLSKPVLLSAYGDRTKKSGYWQVTAGQEPKPLIWADKEISGVQKAENADRVTFTQQTFAEFPDYWVSNATFASPRKVTDANPIIKEYAWGSKVLIDFTNSKGKKLQGTLTLPAGYQPGKKYPMLVYFYEIMSNTHHTFSMPVFDDRPQMSTYASNGYLVFQPDVVYDIGKPGSSAVDCVTRGVKKVIELGYADPKHIGLQGHSWGGYQSSYIVTQTDMFAAVVTGAPPTNLISFYDELYKQTGTVQQGIMEVGQVRMGANVTPWTAKDLYEQQSPVFNVTKIKTPFMILQGTADGAVDWDQGLEFFNAARRNGKEVIFLSYPNEPHHLAVKENQKDFQIRMKQFFDHYLMGAAAPKWMTDGVPQVNKGGPIR